MSGLDDFLERLDAEASAKAVTELQDLRAELDQAHATCADLLREQSELCDQIATQDTIIADLKLRLRGVGAVAV